MHAESDDHDVHRKHLQTKHTSGLHHHDRLHKVGTLERAVVSEMPRKTLKFQKGPHGLDIGDGGVVKSVRIGTHSDTLGVKPGWLAIEIAGVEVEGKSKHFFNELFTAIKGAHGPYDATFAVPHHYHKAHTGNTSAEPVDTDNNNSAKDPDPESKQVYQEELEISYEDPKGPLGNPAGELPTLDEEMLEYSLRQLFQLPEPVVELPEPVVELPTVSAKPSRLDLTALNGAIKQVYSLPDDAIKQGTADAVRLDPTMLEHAVKRLLDFGSMEDKQERESTVESFARSGGSHELITLDHAILEHSARECLGYESNLPPTYPNSTSQHDAQRQQMLSSFQSGELSRAASVQLDPAILDLAARERIGQTSRVAPSGLNRHLPRERIGQTSRVAPSGLNRHLQVDDGASSGGMQLDLGVLEDAVRERLAADRGDPTMRTPIFENNRGGWQGSSAVKPPFAFERSLAVADAPSERSFQSGSQTSHMLYKTPNYDEGALDEAVRGACFRPRLAAERCYQQSGRAADTPSERSFQSGSQPNAPSERSGQYPVTSLEPHMGHRALHLDQGALDEAVRGTFDKSLGEV